MLAGTRLSSELNWMPYVGLREQGLTNFDDRRGKRSRMKGILADIHVDKQRRAVSSVIATMPRKSPKACSTTCSGSMKSSVWVAFTYPDKHSSRRPSFRRVKS